MGLRRDTDGLKAGSGAVDQGRKTGPRMAS